MKQLQLALLLGLLISPATRPAMAQDSCAEFNKLAAKTYNFDLHKLTPATAPAVEKNLDAFWATVTKRKQEFLPCLQKAVADPKSGAYLRFDGSNLLISLAPTDANKKLQIEVYTGANIKDSIPQRWLLTLTQLATQGYDISAAAERWLKEDVDYYLPEHGDYHVNKFRGALSLFGSMNEKFATPVLVRIATDQKSPYRGEAIAILGDEYTPESRKALKAMDVSTFPEDWRPRVQLAAGDKLRLQPRNPPKISRKEWLPALEALTKGNAQPFLALVGRQPDGERDAAAALTTEDLPLLRRVRRIYIANDNPHAYEFYVSFTQIIGTIVVQDEIKQRKATTPS